MAGKEVLHNPTLTTWREPKADVATQQGHMKSYFGWRPRSAQVSDRAAYTTAGLVMLETYGRAAGAGRRHLPI